jgi:hypothetical protein
MEDTVTRQKHLAQATTAAERASELAEEADRYAHHDDHQRKVAPIAAAGALWADVARAHAEIAAAMTAEEK